MNKKIVYIFQIVCAIFIISSLFYFRLIVVRVPKNLYIVEDGYIKANIIIMLIVGLSVTLYMLKINIYENKKTLNAIQKILEQILTFLEHALQELHVLIMTYIPDNYEKMSYLSKKFYNTFEKKSEAYFLLILFIIRFIILITFLFDVFVYFELAFMYKALYLLCFSLMIQLWFYMLSNFAENLNDIREDLIIENLGIDEQTKLPITNYYLKEGVKHLDLEYHVQEFILCSKLTGYLAMYNKYKTFLTPKINIVIYSLYLIGWLYILIVNLSLITTMPEVFLFQNNIEPFSETFLKKIYSND